MANNKFSKFFAAAIFFATGTMLSLGYVASTSVAEAKTSVDEYAVIGEDLPRNISFEETLRAPESKRVVTTKVNKKNAPAAIQTTWNRCYVHVLEQQGSPTAQTVKVCE